MTEDFANSSATHNSQPQERIPRKQGSTVLGRIVLVLALLAVVAAAFMGGHHLGQQSGITQQKIAEQLKLQQQVQLQANEIKRLKSELATKPKQKRSPLITEVGELTFYDDLINDRVDQVEENSSAEASKKMEQNVADIIAQSQQHSSTNKLPLYIQVGSFADKTIAQATKQQVIALGMISYIQPVTLSNGRHRYRVAVGPYPDMKQAIAAKKVLKAKLHLNGLITRINYQR
ncbi:MAG: SPOR domain-containing protein [Mariprofundales bacterium]|nr:SPOR domain-containing protein [Mariprofundales bacterium]